MFSFPGNEENQCHAGTDGAIGNVEGGKTDFAAAARLQIKAKEIHDFVSYQTIGKISSDTAKNQSERNLADQRMRVEMVSREKQRDESEEHDDDKGAVIAAENVPRRPSIAPVNEFEKTVNDDFFTARSKATQHQPFGELVEHEDDQRDNSDTTVRDLKNGFGQGHDKLLPLI